MSKRSRSRSRSFSPAQPSRKKVKQQFDSTFVADEGDFEQDDSTPECSESRRNSRVSSVSLSDDEDLDFEDVFDKEKVPDGARHDERPESRASSVSLSDDGLDFEDVFDTAVVAADNQRDECLDAQDNEIQTSAVAFPEQTTIEVAGHTQIQDTPGSWQENSISLVDDDELQISVGAVSNKTTAKHIKNAVQGTTPIRQPGNLRDTPITITDNEAADANTIAAQVMPPTSTELESTVNTQPERKCQPDLEKWFDRVAAAANKDAEEFEADIVVNGTRVGTLTQKKIHLDVKTISQPLGEACLAKITNRVLRISEIPGRDGFKITFPKIFCETISITYTKTSCSATADGDLFFQQDDEKYKDILNQVRATVASHESQRNKDPVVTAETPQAIAYREWRELTNLRLEGIIEKSGKKRIDQITAFPNVPPDIRQCPKPMCTRRDEKGKKRFWRHIKECKHDLENWFVAVAGGYNEQYKQILEYESNKWQPGKFKLPEKEPVTPKEKKFLEERMHFRWCVGELCKVANELLDELDKKRSGKMEW